MLVYLHLCCCCVLCNPYNYIFIHTCVCMCVDLFLRTYVCTLFGIAFYQFYFTSYLRLIQLVILLLHFFFVFLPALQSNIFHIHRIRLLLYKFILRFYYYFILVRLVLYYKENLCIVSLQDSIKTKVEYFRISKKNEWSIASAYAMLCYVMCMFV